MLNQPPPLMNSAGQFKNCHIVCKVIELKLFFLNCAILKNYTEHKSYYIYWKGREFVELFLE